MSVSPPATWQPPLFARPSHGLLARHGWVWVAVPGGTILILSITLAGFLGSSSKSQGGTASNVIGFVSLLGLGLLVIGLPVRAVIVHRHRRRCALNPTLLPALSGRYAGAPAGHAAYTVPTIAKPAIGEADTAPAPPEHARIHAGLHVALGILLTVWVTGCVGLVVYFSAQGAYEGWRAVRLQHSSSAAHLSATLDQNTSVQHGRGTYYYDRVSYTIDGKTEDDVNITADSAQRAGDPISVIVEPGAPRTAIAASDHGWDDLIPAGLILVIGAATGVAILVVPRRKARRNARDGTRAAVPGATANKGG